MSVNWTEAWGTKIPKNKGTGQDRKEYMKAYMPKYREEHKDEINRRHREIYDPSWGKIAPGRVPLNAAKDPPPPCGGDCRNCENAKNPERDCPYLDWYDKLDKKREARRRANRAYRERRKERMSTDPEYAEEERAKGREATARMRARKKAYIEAQKTKGARTDGKGREQGAGHAAAGGGQGEMRPGGAGRGYDPGGV